MMKVSGFTIARNAIKLRYPIIESITSILPIVDEFIICVGDSEDETLATIRSIKSPKIRIIQSRWDFTQKEEVLSQQTNIALKECAGDWAFYLQSDEVIHEFDLPKIHYYMKHYHAKREVDALRFYWLHFYGSHYRYRIDAGWYQKQDRIIRNDGSIESYGDAYAFRRKDGESLRTRKTGCFVYHYGWVFSPEQMAHRRVNAGKIWHVDRSDIEQAGRYEFGDLDQLPVYFGSHPSVMQRRIQEHLLSNEDWRKISRKYWWHPARILRLRYKTPKRLKKAFFK